MKLAIICPIGPLDKYGYGHVAADCIASMVDFADHVFLMQSARDQKGNGLIPKDGHITLISDERTWFAGGFDAQKVMDNADLGADLADGYDVAMCMMLNWYVPPQNTLRQACQRVAGSKAGWGWLYRRDQLGMQMFHANTRLPWIVALRPNRWHFAIDSVKRDSLAIPWERGDWPEHNQMSVVDLQLEMTREEMQERLEFVRFHKDLMPKRPDHFEWDYWRRYYVAKYSKKTKASDKPIGAGMVVATNPSFVSREILASLDRHEVDEL